jgi:DNA adenine methylase
MPIARPLIRWAGSKRALATKIVSFAPPHFGSYFEPFCGSACVFFSLRPENSVLSDVNASLVEMYREVVKHPLIVHDTLTLLPKRKQFYYDLRGLDTSALTSRERAVRFLYLNRFSFNGVYRTNRRGDFNVPRGLETGDFPERLEFVKSARLLRQARIRCADFAEVLSDCKRGDFVYLDPPYVERQRTEYGQFGYNVLATSDLPRLAQVLNELDRNGVRFLLSYTHSSELESAIPVRWVRRLHVPRNVGGFAGPRKRAREVLIANYTPRVGTLPRKKRGASRGH